jgi:hypothetical protein
MESHGVSWSLMESRKVQTPKRLSLRKAYTGTLRQGARLLHASAECWATKLLEHPSRSRCDHTWALNVKISESWQGQPESTQEGLSGSRKPLHHWTQKMKHSAAWVRTNCSMTGFNRAISDIWLGAQLASGHSCWLTFRFSFLDFPHSGTARFIFWRSGCFPSELPKPSTFQPMVKFFAECQYLPSCCA